MPRESTVGIIGAYGMTGKVVARELTRTTDLNLVLGGRDGSMFRIVIRVLGQFNSEQGGCDASSLPVCARGCTNAFVSKPIMHNVG